MSWDGTFLLDSFRKRYGRLKGERTYGTAHTLAIIGAAQIIGSNKIRR
jgi:hypothetical protein